MIENLSNHLCKSNVISALKLRKVSWSQNFKLLVKKCVFADAADIIWRPFYDLFIYL